MLDTGLCSQCSPVAFGSHQNSLPANVAACAVCVLSRILPAAGVTYDSNILCLTMDSQPLLSLMFPSGICQPPGTPRDTPQKNAGYLLLAMVVTIGGFFLKSP